MHKFWVTLGVTAALLISADAARADIIAFAYTASSAVNPVDGSNTLYNNNNSLKASSIVFTAANGAASFDASTGVSTQFIVYNLKTLSTATPGPGTYDSFTNVPFKLSVTLTDLATSSQQALTFSGAYTADHVSSSSSHVDSATQGITWTTPLSVTQTIGNNLYTISLVGWTAPGAPGSPGSILAEVTTVPNSQDVGGDGGARPPSGAPEPTALALASIAVPTLLLTARRRRHAAKRPY